MASWCTVDDLNSFFKSSLTGMDQVVLENILMDYFGDEERECNNYCLIAFIKMKIIDITLQ